MITYAELVRGYLTATKEKYPCTEIVLGKDAYAEVLWKIEVATKTPIQTSKNYSCVYCRKINPISESSCKGCGASQGESIIKCKKNEVRFMGAKLIIDYLLGNEEVRFINYNVPQISCSLSQIRERT